MFNFHSYRVGAVFLSHIKTALIAQPNGPLGSKLDHRLKINTPRINILKLSPTKVSRTVVNGNVYVSKFNTTLNRFLKYF
jgi:hypothetical protein